MVFYKRGGRGLILFPAIIFKFIIVIFILPLRLCDMFEHEFVFVFVFSTILYMKVILSNKSSQFDGVTK